MMAAVAIAAFSPNWVPSEKRPYKKIEVINQLIVGRVNQIGLPTIEPSSKDVKI